MADLFGHSSAIATGSGTQALLLALLSAGMGPGSRVAIPAFTCAAVLHAVEWSGAEPVLLDCAEGRPWPDPGSLEGRGAVDALVLVHPWGYPLDPGPWQAQVPIVIEDAAQSVGARQRDRPVGAFGNVAIVSFYATKMLCAGEGGMLSSSDPSLLERADDLRDYDGRSTHARRFNFKMSDLQAAMARVQLARLDEFLERRRGIAARYDSELEALGLTPVVPDGDASCSYYRYLCWSSGDVSALLDYCQQQGVHCRRPVPVTLDAQRGMPAMVNARRAWEGLVSLPIYPSLTEDEQNRVLDVLSSARREGAA
jgi:dTDP-4-amino-4,6-dideoxygalactose transaminase